MRITYDADGDAAYIYIADAIGPGEAAQQVVTEVEAGTIIIDLSRSGRVLGIELLSARRLLPPEIVARHTPPNSR